MRKIVKSIALIAAAGSLLACNEKLKIAAPYKNITVVYGLLDQSDTAHYVRIQKAFMDENQSAIDMAKVADSSFYNALAVSIKEIGPSGNVLNTIPLTKVDLTNEGYPKATGAFFNTPSYAYKFKYPLKASNEYRLIVLNTNTGNIDSSSTPVIDTSGPVTIFGVQEWIRPNETINFSRMFGFDGKPIGTNYIINIPATVGAAQLILRFKWTDSNIVTHVATRKAADFSGFSQTTIINPGVTKSFEMTAVNKNIFDFLRSVMGTPADNNQYRYMDSCDMFLYVAGTEYRKYNDLNSNKGGLTADEIRPVYSNIRGKDVMGLFNTRTFTKRLNMGIGNDTRDSLQSNSITRDLNIRFR